MIGLGICLESSVGAAPADPHLYADLVLLLNSKIPLKSLHCRIHTYEYEYVLTVRQSINRN
jgi:hypothetical protein